MHNSDNVKAYHNHPRTAPRHPDNENQHCPSLGEMADSINCRLQTLIANAACLAREVADVTSPQARLADSRASNHPVCGQGDRPLANLRSNLTNSLAAVDVLEHIIYSIAGNLGTMLPIEFPSDAPPRGDR
jgi:hypothetical protein